MKRVIFNMIVILCGILGLQSAHAQTLTGKKVLLIDSYHEGYAWSDGIVAGAEKAFKGTGVNLKIERMDTKRNGSEEFKKKAGQKVKSVIESFKPDLVIAADDNASKYVIVAFYKNSQLPFVFCGLNWDAGVYGFPYKNMTGMIEVNPIPQLLDQLKPLAKGNRIGLLAADNETSRKEVENYKKAFGISLTSYYAKDYNDYKKGFLELQTKVDMLLMESDGGLYDDKLTELNAFVLKNSKIPSGSSYDFMASRAVISFAKIAEEQGEWAAQAALKILKGAAPSSIPIAKNQKGALIINAKLAQAMKITVPYELVQMADKILE